MAQGHVVQMIDEPLAVFLVSIPNCHALGWRRSKELSDVLCDLGRGDEEGVSPDSNRKKVGFPQYINTVREKSLLDGCKHTLLIIDGV